MDTLNFFCIFLASLGAGVTAQSRAAPELGHARHGGGPEAERKRCNCRESADGDVDAEVVTATLAIHGAPTGQMLPPS